MLYDLWNVECNKAEEEILRELAKHMVANGFDIEEELKVIKKRERDYVIRKKEQDYERPF